MKLLNVKSVLIYCLILFSCYPYGKSFANYMTYSDIFIQRQFGSAITVNAITILTIIVCLFAIYRLKKVPKDAFAFFMLISFLSILFPNSQERDLTVIALYMLVQYYIIYVLIVNFYDVSEIKLYLEVGFKIVLLIQTVIGCLSVFKGIDIHYISDWAVDSYRDGYLRMNGTFSHSGEFSLFISIIYVYFLNGYIFTKKKSYIKYIFICLFDIYFSGSRSMIICSAIILMYVLLKRYKNNSALRIFVILSMICGGFVFVRSDTFYQLFIENSIIDMFYTRMIHWIIGFRMFFKNWILGVGLNNSVEYLRNNVNLISDINYSSLEDITFYLTNPIHNSIIIVLCELGIVGGIAYINIYFSCLKECIKIIKNKSEFTFDGMFIISALLVYVIYAFQGWALLKETAWIVFVIIIAYQSILKSTIQYEYDGEVNT